MRTLKNPKGFTIIELMTVVIVIGILVAIAIPNYAKFAKRAKEAVVRENMHTVQLGVEAFAVDQLGTYPQPADEAALKLLLPRGLYPDNPFTNVETAVAWGADPVAPGDMGIANLPGGGYRIRGHGSDALLQDITVGN